MSAAAAGGPPPNRQIPMPGDGLAGGSHASNGANTGAFSSASGRSRVFPHIDDLVAVQPDVNPLAPIRKLLEKGDSCAKQADTHLDFRRPDIALQEYINASTIIVDLIPRHKDYPELKSDRGDLHRLYAGLQKRISARHGNFEEIKKLIKEDNARSGVQPTAWRGSSNDPTISAPHNGELKSEPATGPTESTQKQFLGSLGVHLEDGDFGRSSMVGLPSPPADESQSTRRKPPVQPKPNALHGRAIQSHLPLDHSATHEKDLAARFSRLRGAGPHSPVQDPRIRTQSVGMPDAADLIGKRESTPFLSPVISNTKSRPDRPLGPRDMPKAPTAPPKPQKVPLNVEIPSMPKLPDAIYSPARSLDNPANLDMLRSGSRNAFGAPGMPPSVAPTSRVLRSTTISSERSDHSARPQRLPNGTGSNISLDLQLPDASTVTAEELFEYLKRGSDALSVLVVDIRNRGDFNDGHIMSHSIICIEPIVLRHGISAEELEQSLVLSPEAEQSLFDTRETFDLVVYYDQSSTSSEKNGSGSLGDDLILGDFSKAVYDYGYEKRLKRPPRLLVGGLDAWVDLVGPRALETVQGSDATSMGTAKGHAKPFSSAPKSRQANIIMARRVKHGVRILSKEEQNEWEATFKEKVAEISPNEVSYIRTTEDFFRRFPEPSAIQESMVSPPHLSSFQSSNSQSHNLVGPDAAISYPNKSSLVPQIPARPAPALPRQSYSGVSERTKYSSTAMGSASPFEYKGTSTISGEKKTRTGLVNCGNTCYMNSVLQAFKGTRVLYDAIMTLDRDTNKLPLRPGETEPPKQQLILAFQTVFLHLSSGLKTYKPVEFKVVALHYFWARILTFNRNTAIKFMISRSLEALVSRMQVST
jgi:ubiquitin carboxyl-terminal hydrolase 8